MSLPTFNYSKLTTNTKFRTVTSFIMSSSGLLALAILMNCFWPRKLQWTSHSECQVVGSERQSWYNQTFPLPVPMQVAKLSPLFFHAQNLSIWMLTTECRRKSRNLQILIPYLYSASVLHFSEVLTCVRLLKAQLALELKPVRTKLFIWTNKTRILQIIIFCSDPLSFFPGVPLYPEQFSSLPPQEYPSTLERIKSIQFKIICYQKVKKIKKSPDFRLETWSKRGNLKVQYIRCSAIATGL